MHEPFLIPARFERAARHFGHETEDVRAAKRAETGLVLQRIVRIAFVKRSASPAVPIPLPSRPEHAEQNQTGLMVSLIESIDVDPFSQIAEAADIPGRGIELVRGRLESIFN